MGTPGASQTVLDVQVPYSPASLETLLGKSGAGGSATPVISSAASASTAALLARKAYERAAALSAFGTPVLGLACTAALSTTRVRRGEDRACLAVFGGGDAAWHWDLGLDKAAGRARWEQDGLVSRAIVVALAESLGSMASVPSSEAGHADLKRLASDFELGLLPSDRLERSGPGSASADADSPLSAAVRRLLSGQARCAEAGVRPGHVLVDAPRPGQVYLPGSFNPLHHGHRQLLEVRDDTCINFPD